MTTSESSSTRPANNVHPIIAPDDVRALRRAHQQLEHPSLAARLTSVVGTPIEIALKLLPRRWSDALNATADKAIKKALEAAMTSINPVPQTEPYNGMHKLMGACTGAFGGFFGLPAMLIEMPVSTVIMLRTIGEIAHSEGEDLTSVDTRLACVEVFALGGRTEADDAADTGYYGMRLALAVPVASAARHLAGSGLGGDSPALLSLVETVASRFGAALSNKAAAQVIPLIGAGGAAMINVIFLDHFQHVAHGHFTVRRLERTYGAEVVQQEYQRLD